MSKAPIIPSLGGGSLWERLPGFHARLPSRRPSGTLRASPYHLSVSLLSLIEALALHFPVINQIDGKLGHLFSVGKSELIFDVSLMRLDCFHAQPQFVSN